MSTGDFKKWLEQVGVSYAVSGFSDFGITSAQEFTLLSHDDFKEIMDEVGLKRRDQLKLTVAVRKLDASSPPPMMVVSQDQHDALKNLNGKIANAKETLVALQKFVQECGDSHRAARTKIEQHFTKIISSAELRKTKLLSEAEEEYKHKVSSIEHQIEEITEVLGKLSKTQQDCERLLKTQNLTALGARQNAFESAIKTANLKFDGKPAVSSKIDFIPSEKDVTQVISKEGRVAGSRLRAPVITLSVIGATIEIKWAPRDELNNGEKLIDMTIQYAESEDEKQEGERDWKNWDQQIDVNQRTISMRLKYNTFYVVRMRLKSDGGWSEFCDAVDIKTKTKQWQFVGITTWYQNCAVQSDAKQDNLMNEAAAGAYPGSIAASGEMYEKKLIVGLPIAPAKTYTTFTTPGNKGSNYPSAVSGHSLRGVSQGTNFNGSFSHPSLGSGARDVICVKQI